MTLVPCLSEPTIIEFGADLRQGVSPLVHEVLDMVDGLPPSPHDVAVAVNLASHARAAWDPEKGIASAKEAAARLIRFAEQQTAALAARRQA